jgi:hypothetical protein
MPFFIKEGMVFSERAAVTTFSVAVVEDVYFSCLNPLGSKAGLLK